MARYFNDELYHHGILGQRWGIRRFQNEDGSLTPKGRERYGVDERDHNNRGQLINRKNDIQEIVSDGQKRNPHAVAANKNVAEKFKKESANKSNRGHKTAKTIGVVLAVAGAVSVAAIIASNKSNKTDSSNSVKSILDKDGETPVSNIGGISQAVKDAFSDYGTVVNDEFDEKAVNYIGRWVDRQRKGDQLGNMSVGEYSQLNKEDYEWPSGHVFGRISKNDEKDARDMTYLSASEEDVNRYRAFLPGFWKSSGLDFTNEYYQINMSSTQALKSPSDKKRVDIFRDLIKTSKSFQKNLLGTELTKELSDAEYGDLARRYYKQFAFKLTDKNNPAVQEYCDSVKALGYNALIDDNDKGNLSDLPLIVLDHSAVKIDSSEKLTTDRIAESYRNLKPVDTYSTSDNIKNLGENINGLEQGYYVGSYYDGMRKAAGLA